MVKYYRNMLPHRAHILAPLTSQTGAPPKGKKQSKYIWTKDMQTALDQMQALMAMDILCAYHNHNKPFHFYIGASDYQLGSCIMQEGWPVAYYSKKLNNAQHNYSTVGTPLYSNDTLWILSMLLGAELHTHTNHKIFYTSETPCNADSNGFLMLMNMALNYNM